MGFVTMGPSIIPPPEGMDPSNLESLKSLAHLMEPKHFIFPFIAHAGGTLVGAFVAAKVAATRKLTFALVIGVIFLLGGIAMTTMIPSPMWYNVVDVLFAYIPMAYLGAAIAGTKS